MFVQVSLRLSETVHRALVKVAEESKRSKSHLIREAIELYLEENPDYRIAFERLNDQNDEVICSKGLWKRLASED